MVRRMSSARHRIACLVAVAVLGAPSAALAQGAGDEQYQDPFAGGDQNQSDDSQGSGTAQATPTPTPAAPAQAPPPTAAPSPAPAVAASQQLPRTGNDPITPAIAGFWLLLGGVALRAKVRVR
jgi:LPXTG-motif cell wall-anchored protein